MEIALYNVKRNLLVEEWLNDETSISLTNSPPPPSRNSKFHSLCQFTTRQKFLSYRSNTTILKINYEIYLYPLGRNNSFFFLFTKYRYENRCKILKSASNRYINFLIHQFILLFSFRIIRITASILTAKEQQRFANNGIWRLKEVVFPRLVRGWTEGANHRTEAN